MTLDKTRIIIFASGLIIGLLCGFFVGKGIYDQPIRESVTHDTVCVTDTIPHYYPKEIQTEKVRTEYRWLTRVETDTVTNTITELDTVMVGVPIESKHYHSDDYDAWVSGFMPKLDSVKVYRKTEYITTTITKEKRQSPWSLDVSAGAEYFTNGKDLYPFAQGELDYRVKDSRFSVGINGGIYKADKVEPFFGGKVKIRVF